MASSNYRCDVCEFKEKANNKQELSKYGKVLCLAVFYFLKRKKDAAKTSASVF